MRMGCVSCAESSVENSKNPLTAVNMYHEDNQVVSATFLFETRQGVFDLLHVIVV